MKSTLCACTLSLLVIALLPALVLGQSGGTTDANGSSGQASSTPMPAGRTTADEAFELDITERRITQRSFEASTTVEAGEESAHGLFLRIGVAFGSGEIDLLLKNVKGRVRFHATLDRVISMLNTRRAPGGTP